MILKVFSRISLCGVNLVVMLIQRFGLNCSFLSIVSANQYLKTSFFQMAGFDVLPVVVALMLADHFTQE